MTAEVAVMNREAVALAADSAVTSGVGGKEKVSTSANKLFALSRHHPVGIMFYGNALFMDIPWETIIKLYRANRVPKNGFNTLEEYANDFISFLYTENIEFPTEAESYYIGSLVGSCFSLIQDQIEERLEQALQENHDFDEGFPQKSACEVISKFYEEWRAYPVTLPIPLKLSRNIIRKYKRNIDETIEMFFGAYDLPKQYSGKLRQMLVDALSKLIWYDICSGIVVAGFGENEVTPSIKSFLVEGIVEDKLKYMVDTDHSLDKDARTGVVTFAQGEMVHRFMDGVDPLYRHTEKAYLEGLCDDYAEKVVGSLSKYDDREKEKIKEELSDYGNELVNEFITIMKKFIEEQFSDPTVAAVSRLPKNELAALAEALVYLTSLKRKVSPEPETVAEPIDVAVISKGDGFIWIKRKHYFTAELNPLFLYKYYKELLHEHKKEEYSNPPDIDEN